MDRRIVRDTCYAEPVQLTVDQVYDTIALAVGNRSSDGANYKAMFDFNYCYDPEDANFTISAFMPDYDMLGRDTRRYPSKGKDPLAETMLGNGYYEIDFPIHCSRMAGD
eukprot:g2946.t1